MTPSTTELLVRFGSHPVLARLASSGVTSAVRRRYVSLAADEALESAQRLAAHGAMASLHVRDAEVVTTRSRTRNLEACRELIDAVVQRGLPEPEISVKMEQLGYRIDGAAGAERALRVLADQAEALGVLITLDMEFPEQVEDTMAVWSAVRADHPLTGIAVQANLRRTERDCEELATTGARVRLCKGGYGGTADIAYTSPHQIDLSFVRCATRLLAGDSYPMFATHDERLVEIAAYLADRRRRQLSEWEVQTLQGVAPGLVERSLAAGRRVRCYVPFGPSWYSWFLRRIGERPANLVLLAGSLTQRGVGTVATPPRVGVEESA